MKNNPKRIFEIYDISEALNSAYSRAFSTSNIISGFKCTGISPFNGNIFSDDDFCGSYVFDSPLPTLSVDSAALVTPCTSSSSTTPVTDDNHNIRSNERIRVSPKEVEPYPKVAPERRLVEVIYEF